jgi:TRAP-type C4-dicarboxylate transport system permease small subunit
MDKEFKEKIGITLVLSLFFVQALFGGYYYFQKNLSPKDSKVEISLLTSQGDVKGVTFSSFDNVLNYSYLFLVISANFLAILFVANFVFKEDKKKR